MLVSVDLKVNVDLKSNLLLNSINYLNEELNSKLEYLDLVLTINLDTEDNYFNLTHINGMPIIYNDIVKTNDQFLKEVNNESKQTTKKKNI